MGFNLATLKEKLLAVFNIDQETRETAANNIAQAIYDSYNDGETEWTNLPLTTGFSAASTARMPMYRLNGQNVELKGVVYRSTSTSTVFATLPVGFRPGYTVYFPMCEITNSQTIVSAIQINSNGSMYAGSSSSQYIHLASVRFTVAI